jgi:hypothetical protein
MFGLLYSFSAAVRKGTVSVAKGPPPETARRKRGNGAFPCALPRPCTGEGRRVKSRERADRDMIETAEYLREQARRCRRLAKSVVTADVVKTLSGMAEEYDARADRLEAEAREDEA